MALLNRLSMAATASAAAISTLGTLAIAPAHAELFKYSFEGNGMCGYVIYDDSTKDSDPSNTLGDYSNSIRELFVDLGKKGVIKQSNNTISVVRVLLKRPGGFAYAPPDDDEVKFFDPIAKIGAVFHFPKGTFSESTALPKALSATASTEIYRNIRRGRDFGPASFLGNTNVRVEQVSKPTAGLACTPLSAVEKS